MTHDNVLYLPRRNFQDWYGWAECEISILGHEAGEHDYDWQSAFERGLRPEQAAAEAVQSLETHTRVP